MYGTLIIKPDGKFHIKANCEGDYPYKTLDTDGTYKISKIQNSFSLQTGLEFTTNSGDKFSLIVSKDNSFNDQWHGYSYTGQ